MNYDLIVVGSGPGGYVAAIRASQLGMKTVLVEREHLGGICLNWGCIPAKSLLKSAQVYRYVAHASEYGVSLEGTVRPDYPAIVARSRNISESMRKGVQFLLQKNNVEIIWGHGRLTRKGSVTVTNGEGKESTVTAKNIILATGARSRQLSDLPQDGTRIIGYKQALALPQQPKTMLVVGSGAIGSELAFFYQSIGTQVILVELMPQIVPLEDEEVAGQLERSFKKAGMKIRVNSTVESVDLSESNCAVTIKTPKGIETYQVDVVLSAAGITPNTDQIGLDELGIETDRNRIKVNEHYQTSADGVFAIGDVINTPALAHVASAEAINCVEYMAGLNPAPINYKNIPGCVYTTPEIASVGMTEKAAKEAGYDIRIGRFPFAASGRAAASGSKDGFAKLIFDAQFQKLLGAHIIGENVTETVSELVVARNLGITAHELIKSIHPHPTMSEAIMEAVAVVCGESVNI